MTIADQLQRIEQQLSRLQQRIERPGSTDGWLDLPAAATYTSLSTKTLRRAVQQGTLNASQTTGKLLFRKQWLDAYLAPDGAQED